MKNILRVLKISKPLYPIIGVLSLLIVVGAVLSLIIPLLSKQIVDQIVSKIQNKGGTVEKLFFFITIMFVLQVLNTVLSAFSERLGDHFAGKLRQFLTEKFYYKVLTLPQSYFDTEISGKILNQLV